MNRQTTKYIHVIHQVFLSFVLIIAMNLPPMYSQPVNTLIGDVVMPSPTAASLGKYADIPVNHFTGVPSISIPLYTVEEGRVSLPITLNYHNHIKVAEPASNVGLGWSLNAGGIITRTVMGTPDEVNNGYFDNGDDLLNPLNSVDWQNSLQVRQVAEGTRDAEPDIFNYNVAGYSGKFFFNKLNKAVFVPDNNVQLKYERNTSGLPYFERLTLITPDGTHYVFGHLETDSELKKGLEYQEINGTTGTAPSSWHLRTITPHDFSAAINLDYKEEKYSYQSPASCIVNWGTYNPSTSVNCNTASGNMIHNISGWRLSSISNSTNTTSVNLDHTSTRQDLDSYSGQSAQRLDRIEIRQGAYCKAFDFTYDYFNSGGTREKYDRWFGRYWLQLSQ